MSISVQPLLAAGFSVKGLTQWRSDEGGGYQFTLCHEGKPAAFVHQDGNGGPTDLRWEGLDWTGQERAMPTNLTPAQIKRYPATVKRAKAARIVFEGLLAALPPVEFPGQTLKVDEGLWMEALLNHLEIVKTCRKHTAFRLPEDGTESYRVLKVPFDAAVKAYLVKKHPDAVILNEEIAALETAA